MINTITAQTMELDDVGEAVGDLLSQLAPKENLLKHSLLILTCNFEYANREIFRELYRALPVPTLGMGTVLAAVKGVASALNIAATLFTSDDTEFSAALSEEDAEGEALFKDIYLRADKELKSAPKLILAFSSLIPSVSGDKVVRAFDEASGGIPLFGALSVYADELKDRAVLFNGEIYTDRACAALVGGAPEISFEVTNSNHEHILKRWSLITKAEGNLIKCVNNVPVLQHLEVADMIKDEQLYGLIAIPLVVGTDKGSFMRALLGINLDGDLMCAGDVPLGASTSPCPLGYEDVITGMSRHGAKLKRAGALIFSCFTRSLALGLNINAEFEAGMEVLEGTPYMMAYSGGHFCPVSFGNGKPENFFHSASVASLTIN